MKEIVNNKIIYNNVLGILSNFQTFINQGVKTYDSPTFANLSITGNTVISGNLYVEGNTAVFNTNVSELEDNIILINRLETSNGVSLNQAGLEIARGTLENYRIVYDEAAKTVKIGNISNLQKLTVHEDNPLNNGIMIYSNAFGGIISTTDITLPINFNSTLNSINGSTGSIVLNGGIGIKKDLQIEGDIISSKNLLNISSSKINLLGNTFIPESNSIFFKDTNVSISSTFGNLNLNANSVVIPTGIPLRMGSNSISTNTGNNLYLNVTDGVLLDNTKKLYFGINKNLNGNGNNLDLNLPTNSNLKFLQDTGILFNNFSRIYSSNNTFNIQSLNDLLFDIPTNQSIIIPQDVPLKFGTNGSTIKNTNNVLQLSGDLTVTGNLNVLGDNTIIQTQTLLIEDNLFVINNNTSSNLSDSGIIVKRDDTLYAGLFFKQSTNEFTFAYSSTQPNSNVTITDYIPIRSSKAYFTNTENAVGFSSGGSLVVSGGARIEKTLYADTIVTNNLQVSSLASDNVSATNQTIGNLKVTGNALFSNTSGNPFIVSGNAMFQSDIQSNGQVQTNNLIVSATSSIGNLYANNLTISDTNNSVLINGSVIIDRDLNINNFRYLNEKAISTSSTYIGWLYLGILDDNTSTFIEMKNDNTILNCLVNVVNNVVDLNYEYTNSKNNNVFVYNNSGVLQLYIKNEISSVTFININSNVIIPFTFTQQGNSTEPSSYINTWILIESTMKLPNQVKNVGTLNISDKLVINDPLPIIANNIQSSQNIGVLFQRYQTENNTLLGDVINDVEADTDILPDQTGVSNLQVKLSTTHTTVVSFYTGYWIKFGNQVRLVTDYSGGTRVLSIKTPWDIQPILGDTIYLYDQSYVTTQYIENEKGLAFGYTNKSDVNNFVNISVNKLILKSTDSNSIQSNGGIIIHNTTNTINNSTGSIITDGGVFINKDLNVQKNVIIGTNNGDTNSNLLLNNPRNIISINHSIGNFSTINFSDDNNLFSIKHDQNQFSIGKNTINVSQDSFIGINTTTNINADLTFKSNGIINIDDNIGSLKILGGNDINNSTFIELHTNDINIKGHVTFNDTTISSNSSSGSVIMNGGVSLYNTMNSSSITSGGALTIGGGISIEKDVYIGGNIYVNGSLFGLNLVTSPTLTFYPTINSSVLDYGNVQLITINNQNTLSFYLEIVPTLASTDTEIEFDLPLVTQNLIHKFDCISSVSGYTDETDVIVLQNILSYGKIGTIRNIIKFQSVSTSTHNIQVICKYTSN
jgi:hypothetical protein